MAIITWIGLGQMGRPMAANLVKAGHDVRGVEINPQASAVAAEAGIPISDTVAEAVAGADFVFTMLPEGRFVEAAVTGPDGVLAHIGAETLIIDCSTVDVSETRALHAAAAAAGVRFLDAPVSGGVTGAAAGTLSIMVGGDPAAFAAAREVLGDIGGFVVHMGDAGAGQATKIVNNMVLGVCLAATCEGADLAERLGLDMTALFQVLTRSSADNWALRNWYPVPGVVDTSPANRDFGPGFTTALLTKDLGLALRAGAATGSALEAATTAHRLFTEHGVDGGAQLDCSSLVQRLRAIAPQQTGVPA